MIDPDFWRLVLRYDASSGVFTWRDWSINADHVFGLAGRQKSARAITLIRSRAGRSAGSPDEANGGRVAIECLGRRVYAHRLAWVLEYKEQPPKIIDHIDGNAGNNRICNLRAATHRQNMCNRKASKNSHSRFLGVEYCTAKKKYRASVRCEYGVFRSPWTSSETDAAKIYNIMALRLHGDFARLNTIDRPGETKSAVPFYGYSLPPNAEAI